MLENRFHILFMHLNCDQTYEGEFNAVMKVYSFQLFCSYINKTFESKARRETETRLYDVMALKHGF